MFEHPLDMEFGNPEFLFPYWDKFNLKRHNSYMGYYFGGVPSLKKAIKNLHKKENNVSNPENYNIVIGNGASQILSAAIYALDKPVFANAPYFPRFPMFADIAGQPWNIGRDYIQIVTRPNNPDGRMTDSFYAKDYIFDLSYNWKQYTEVEAYDSDIMVFSLAKATGHASLRIGWALVRDSEIAQKMQNFIEYNTAGVSLDSQMKACEIIQRQINKKNDVFEFGKKILDSRWKTINHLKNKAPFEILNNQGMFLWCKGKCPPGVIGLNGNNFGVSSDYFRLNIGCDGHTFHRFVKYILANKNKVDLYDRTL